MVTKVDEEFTTEKLLEELREYYPPIKERPTGDSILVCGYTVREYAKSQRISRQAAQRQLEVKQEAGEIRRLWMRDFNGKEKFIYFLTDEKTPA